MTAVLRSELHRAFTLRSSVVSIGAVCLLGLLFGWFSPDMWTLLVGLGAFGVAVVGTTQHFQHRTAVLLYLGQPNRLVTLVGQVVSYALVALAVAAVSGLLVLVDGAVGPYTAALVAVPVMAVFGVATATVVRRANWLFLGVAGWFVFVEGLMGKLKQPLPFTSFLDASIGAGNGLAIFSAWTAVALVGAVVAVRRDVAGE